MYCINSRGVCHAGHAIRGRVRYRDGKNRKLPDASPGNPVQESELTHTLRDPDHLRGLRVHLGLRTVSEKKKNFSPDGAMFLKKQVVGFRDLLPLGLMRDPLKWRNGKPGLPSIVARVGVSPGQVGFGSTHTGPCKFRYTIKSPIHEAGACSFP